MTLDPSPLTLSSSPHTPHCVAADTAKPTPREASILNKLTSDLTRSLLRPTRKTLALLDRALSWLRPFENPVARPASPAERLDLLALLSTHRLILSPYADIDRIEWNLRRSS